MEAFRVAVQTIKALVMVRDELANEHTEAQFAR